MMRLSSKKQLILFDGVCNLCNSWVQYIIKHDKNDLFQFTPIQSEIGQELTKKYNIDTLKTDSIILYSEKQGIHYKSTAALLIARQLGFPINIMIVFLIVPPFIRDWVYNYIAKNRYAWYGKREACMVPSPDIKKKFI